MVTAKQVIASTKSKPIKMPSATPLGSAGYDNARDDIEKVKKLREGSVVKVPTRDYDIANKKYVDDEIDSAPHWHNTENQLGLTGAKSGSFNIGTTGFGTFGTVNTTEVYNSAGDLKIQPDAQGNVQFFADGDVANNEDGRVVNFWRMAPEGDDRFGFYFDQYRTGYCTCTNAYTVSSGYNKEMRIVPGGNGKLRLNYTAGGDITMFDGAATGENPSLEQAGHITAASSPVDIMWTVKDTDDMFHLERENTYILGFNIEMPVEVASKIKLTALGGYAIKLTNKTGANSVQGEVVKTDTANDDAVILAVTGELNPIGVFLDAGIADGAEAWIVVSGIADVLADTAGFTRGDRLVTSLAAATVGRATANNAPSVAVHFQEIGHAVQTAAANTLGRAVIHFL